jgi:hypothetical protein
MRALQDRKKLLTEATNQTVYVKPELADFVTAQREYSRIIQTDRYFLAGSLPAIASLIFIVFFLPSALKYLFQLPQELGFLLAIVVGFIFYILLINLFMGVQLRAHLDSGGWFLSPTEFAINPAGVVWRSNGGNGQWHWHGVQSIKQTKTHIFFFVDRTHAQIIPKRCFESEDAALNFFSKAQGYFDNRHTRHSDTEN